MNYIIQTYSRKGGPRSTRWIPANKIDALKIKVLIILHVNSTCKHYNKYYTTLIKECGK